MKGAVVSVRRGFTLIELLVAIAIIAIVLALAVSAVQSARHAAARTECANNLHQIGIGLHGYHTSNRVFPPGVSYDLWGGSDPYLSWLARILPFTEQDSLWHQAQVAFQQDRNLLHNPPHVDLDTVVPLFICPSDPRVFAAQTSHGVRVAFTSYLGNEGINLQTIDGVLYKDSQTRIADVRDGTSQTLFVGERPPSADLFYGWWYGGTGQDGSGSADMILGVREIKAIYMYGCVSGPYSFREGQLDNQCDLFHFWSLHPGGAHFLFVDGSTHFLSYGSDSILPALATRGGNDIVQFE